MCPALWKSFTLSLDHVAWWSVLASPTCFGVQCFPLVTLYTKSWAILRTFVWVSASCLSKSTPSSSGLSVNRLRPPNINLMNISRLSGTHDIISASLTTAPVYFGCAIMSLLNFNATCTISRNPSSGRSYEGIVLVFFPPKANGTMAHDETA